MGQFSDLSLYVIISFYYLYEDPPRNTYLEWKENLFLVKEVQELWSSSSLHVDSKN